MCGIWRCSTVSFLCSAKHGKLYVLKTLVKRDDRDGSFMRLHSWLIKESVNHSATTNSLCAGIPRELSGASEWKQSRIISSTFPESCFNKSQVQPWQWQMAKQLAPLDFVSLLFFFTSSSCTFAPTEVWSVLACLIIIHREDVSWAGKTQSSEPRLLLLCKILKPHS